MLVRKMEESELVLSCYEELGLCYDLGWGAASAGGIWLMQLGRENRSCRSVWLFGDANYISYIRKDRRTGRTGRQVSSSQRNESVNETKSMTKTTMSKHIL